MYLKRRYRDFLFTLVFSLYYAKIVQAQLSGCYDDCNAPLLTAQSIGSFTELCPPNSPFNIQLQACSACLARIDSDLTVEDLTELSEFIGICNGIIEPASSTDLGPTSIASTRSPSVTGAESTPNGEPTSIGSVDSLPTSRSVPPSTTALTATVAPSPRPTAKACSSTLCEAIIVEWQAFSRIGEFTDYSGCLSLNKFDIPTFYSCSSSSCAASRSIPANVTELFDDCISILENETGREGESKKKLSGGAIAGIVVGAVAVLVISGGALFWFRRRKLKAIPMPPAAEYAHHELSPDTMKLELDAAREPVEIDTPEVKAEHLDGTEVRAELQG